MAERATTEDYEITEPDAARFWAKVGLPDEAGCMPWLASKDTTGYGIFRLRGKRRQAHLVAWVATGNFLDPTLERDHLCRNRWCVNAEHMEEVSHLENVRRGLSGIRQRLRTHCPKGHPYDGENTYITTAGGRMCRICMRQAKRKNTVA